MKSGRFWIGFVGGIVLLLVIAVAVPLLGLIDMSATSDPGLIDRWGELAFHRSVETDAPEAQNPLAGNQAAWQAGFHEFKEMCVHCHGAPEVARAEFADGMSPKPPPLAEEAGEWSDGELFHIIRTGVRRTGMPAFGEGHSDEQIWQLITFLWGMEQLTPAQRQELQAAAGGHGDGHGHGGHGHGGQRQGGGSAGDAGHGGGQGGGAEGGAPDQAGGTDHGH